MGEDRPLGPPLASGDWPAATGASRARVQGSTCRPTRRPPRLAGCAVGLDVGAGGSGPGGGLGPNAGGGRGRRELDNDAGAAGNPRVAAISSTSGGRTLRPGPRLPRRIPGRSPAGNRPEPTPGPPPSRLLLGPGSPATPPRPRVVASSGHGNESQAVALEHGRLDAVDDRHRRGSPGVRPPDACSDSPPAYRGLPPTPGAPPFRYDCPQCAGNWKWPNGP